MNIFRALSVLLIFFLFTSPSCYAEAEGDENTFHSPTAGFTIVKPGNWHFLSAERIMENRGSVRLKDKELEKMVRERAQLPLVAITRYAEPYNDLNPSVQVILRPLGELQGKPPVELLDILMGGFEQVFADFTVQEQPGKTTVGRLNAAQARIAYTISGPDDREYVAISRIWVIPRGSFIFLMSMGTPPDKEDEVVKDFEKMLSSIKIEE